MDTHTIGLTIPVKKNSEIRITKEKVGDLVTGKINLCIGKTEGSLTTERIFTLLHSYDR